MVISSYELFKHFKEHSLSEFFRKNKQMLGFVGKVRTLTMIVHELVTNSLDACEEAGILPEVKVEIEKVRQETYRVTVEDNGPGIPYEYIPKVYGKMLAGTKFHRYMQMRGQQGLGASAVTLYAQMTTGEPVYVISRYRAPDGRLLEARMKVKIDVRRNEPEVLETELRELEEGSTGVRVSACVGEVLYQRGEQGPYEYLRRTAIVNPHARILLREPDGSLQVFERSVHEVIRPPKETKPHPLGVSADDLLFICQASTRRTVRAVFLYDFVRISSQKIKEIEEELKKLGKAEILDKKPQELTFEEAELLVSIFRKLKFYAPPLNVLRPLGEDYIRRSLASILKPEFVYAVTRKPKVYWGGVPFLVEGGIAYGGGAGRSGELEIMRFANNVPLLFDSSACLLTREVKEFNWKSYGLSRIDSLPVTIMLHVVSVHVPYTSAGKQAIAEVPEIKKEVHLLLASLARKLSDYLRLKKKLEKLEKQKQLLEKIAPLVSESLAAITGYSKEQLSSALENLIKKKFAELEEMKKKLGVVE
ncbi:MAG: DNA topoisomerase VI subunit B [bacterium]|nr:DNA topoisomerase VI subunit B [bacterium]